MNKDFFFKSLSIIFSLLICYIFIFIFYFINLEKNFEENFKIKETVTFYNKYFDRINHIRYRDKFRFEIKNDELIFNYFKKQEGKTILLQGDSWFKKLNNYESSQKIVLNNLKTFGKIINGGTSSYSPSLMHNQFMILENDYDIRPENVIIYIDQTDMGDELCRYKNLIQYDKEKKFVKVGAERYPYSQDVFNLHEKIYLSKIELSNVSKLKKTQYYINYKIKKALIRTSKKMNSIIFKHKSFTKKCTWKVIESYKSYLSLDDEKYLKKIIKNYFNYLNKKNYIDKIYVVTHPHKTQFMSNSQKVDISKIISNLGEDFSKIQHINFSEILRKKNFYNDFEKIWKQDLIHLTEEGYNIFLNELFFQIKHIE